ncbi:ABC transporter substrate-binding protein [Rhizobium cremeum]|uniref:ABC transporter substrate-binding protein n=1 Tax=Rhizobium cremeum TaxID=2813827 RepID=UPI001FD3F2A1|nr:ABC transporter substrate-binding protein [Rhizobium cremeum]MCJ7994200.1 ABC transporter substrate-binding protein [Rhizobium cremeum]MCJ7999258.1 ABC transporter substrate-binding protein [Rhizobium cremeum]
MTIRMQNGILRIFLRAGILAAGLAAFAGAAEAQDASIKGTVNIVGFSGVFADNYQKFIIAAFKEKYPGIEVTYQQSKNSAETLALLTLQQADPKIDLALIDVSVAIKANKSGIFAKLDPAKVPSLAEMPDWARLDGDKAIAFSQDNLAILYNTDNVKEPPTSWNDLTDPKYKGKIAAKLGDTRGVILLPILDKLKGADYKDTVDPAIDMLKEIAPNVSTWEPAPDCYAVVQSGEVDLSICWNGRAQYLHDTQGGKIAVAAPKEGSIGQTNTIGLVENSRNAEAAQLFINYALGTEAQATFAEKSFYGPVNTKVTLTDAVAARIYGSKEAQAAQMSLDWNFVADKYSAWIQRINREVIALN